MPITIGFHDVVEDLALARPIAPGHTTLYSLDRARFRECLAAVKNRPETESSQREDVLLTFDDGAESAFTSVAPELEEFGWRGHFFVTTNWIDQPGFLSGTQIADLRRRGHTIGSHSCSHPERMSSLSWADLREEWINSCAVLKELIQEPVTRASVPGGHYSAEVARAAAAAGITRLFTSEPTTSISWVGDCQVLGRYSVRQNTSPRNVAAIAAGASLPRWEQAASWRTKKIIQWTLGRWYEPLRSILAEHA